MHDKKRTNRKNPGQVIKMEMLTIRDKSKDYSCQHLTAKLKNRGFRVKKKKVRCFIRKFGIECYHKI